MTAQLTVAPCSHQAAKYAVEHWHYSGALPPPKLVRFGIWEDDTFTGAIVYGRGATEKLAAPYGLHPTEACELVRVALTDHQTPVSALIARTLTLLRERSPGLRLVVSFADPAHGHHGGIYQAGNWLYMGTTAPSKTYVDPATGRRYHERVVSPTGWKRQYGQYKRVPRPADLVAERLPGKHRYVYPLDKAMRRTLTKNAKPYPPPCGRGLDGEPTRSHRVSAGSTPAVRSTTP